MKYSNFVELSANYESVVDLDADRRNPNLWKEYIVHGDMEKTIDAICQSLNWEDKDKRRSFWIHGAYGTGKTYGAIVLKHLLEDKIEDVEEFFRRPSLARYKRRFLKLRNQGDFLVPWKSGVTDIRSGTHLMMEMEVTIKEKLKEEFGENAYYGRNSLVGAAQEVVASDVINWEYIFSSGEYGISDEYRGLEDFRSAVSEKDLSAINLVKRICDDQKIAMFSDTVSRFEEWVKDVIEGNGLKHTGIVFIWDEFTGFLRDCGDDNVLQRLSELCKQADAPFFMCFIVHRDPAWVDQLGGETYERILHRYHELEYHITESAAYDLIGDSIIPRAGMSKQWDGVKKDLLESLKKYSHEFDDLEQSINIMERMSKLTPIHPMTLSLLSTVAQNFGASQRTLFRFMKDRKESDEGVGFVHYIQAHGPTNWPWLTADYLWDYFFLRSSDIRGFEAETRKVIQHYHNKNGFISDEQAMHVFKAALLLIAVAGASTVSNLHSRQVGATRGLRATKKMLYRCFRGVLDEAIIDNYLSAFEETDLLRLDQRTHDDATLELPFRGGGELFDMRLEQNKKKFTRHSLFSKNGIFSKALENSLWDRTRATHGRLYIAACSSETRLINMRLNEVKEELEKCPWKIGLLAINISEINEFGTLRRTVAQLARDHGSARLVLVLIREPCTSDLLDRWCEIITNQELAAEDGKRGSASRSEAEATALLAQWVATTSESQMSAFWSEVEFSGLFGRSDLIKRIENEVLFEVFPAGLERVVEVHTAFRPCTEIAVIGGLTKNIRNRQVRNIADSLEAMGAWDIDELEKLQHLNHPKAEVVTELARLINEELVGSSRMSLDALWAKLQNAPFGYYDTLAAGCIMGLCFRSFVNGAFNWIDTSNNTHLPTPEHLASMLNRMISGKALNEYFTSGSALWQKFRPYARSIFGLTEQETVTEAESRKFIKVKIQESGVPLWSLKYLPEEKLGGSDGKRLAVRQTELLCDFVYQASQDQDKVMDEIWTLFNGRGWLRKSLTEAFSDKPLLFSCFKKFVYNAAPELYGLVQELGYTDKDFFDALGRYLQDAVSTWLEEQVTVKLADLANELTVIIALNKVLNTKKKSYAAHQRDLNNVLTHMKIPGTVIEGIGFSWFPALKALRKISQTDWVNICDKESILTEVQKGGKVAWEHVIEPQLIFDAYLRHKNILFNDAELHHMFRSLPLLSYDTTETVFRTALDGLLKDISYNRHAKRLEELWQEKTGTRSVSHWCNTANVPIAWVIDGPFLEAVETLKRLQDLIKVDASALESAVAVMEMEEYTIPKNESYLADCFFRNVGESYRKFFEKSKDLLIGRIKTDSRISSEVFTWQNKIALIRETLDFYLQEAYEEEINQKVRSMDANELREIVLTLLETNPELYSHFLD